MNFIVNKDGIRISETTDNRYEQTRKRITKFRHKQDMSDKEIIEYLTEEIEQYRNTIKQQRRIIDNLNKSKTIDTEINTYHCGVDSGTGKDFTVVKWYEDGILTKEEIKPYNE